ncbi:MAG: type II toxin-antitoxin system VapC family toxin [Bacteroidota bacterium]
MSGERVFVDTGAWLALALRDDAHHEAATRTLTGLLAASTRLVTTNHVAGETYTYLARVRDSCVALDFVRRMRLSTALDYVFVDEVMESKAYEWLERYRDQRFSFVDATSFAAMTELGLKRTFTFDKHFAAAGFERLPGA